LAPVSSVNPPRLSSSSPPSSNTLTLHHSLRSHLHSLSNYTYTEHPTRRTLLRSILSLSSRHTRLRSLHCSISLPVDVDIENLVTRYSRHSTLSSKLQQHHQHEVRLRSPRCCCQLGFRPERSLWSAPVWCKYSRSSKRVLNSTDTNETANLCQQHGGNCRQPVQMRPGRFRMLLR